MVEKSTDLFLGGAKDAWDYVVLDEGHTIKNRRTKTHASCQRICKPKTRRVMLTGTPIMNNLEVREKFCSVKRSNKFSHPFGRL